MKKIAIFICLATAVSFGTAYSQTREVIKIVSNEKTKTECEKLVNKAECFDSNSTIAKPPRPPLPPQPPEPPQPPSKTPIAADAPPPPEPPEIASLPDAPPPPPPPPPPPAPPELKVPAQAQVACEGKKIGEKVTWSPNAGEYYAGVCVEKGNRIFFEVHQHRLHRTNQK